MKQTREEYRYFILVSMEDKTASNFQVAISRKHRLMFYGNFNCKY